MILVVLSIIIAILSFGALMYDHSETFKLKKTANIGRSMCGCKEYPEYYRLLGGINTNQVGLDLYGTYLKRRADMRNYRDMYPRGLKYSDANYRRFNQRREPSQNRTSGEDI